MYLIIHALTWSISLSVKQKRKGLKGSVDLEKIKCVETVQPEPNAPQERMYAFQVYHFLAIFNSLTERCSYESCVQICKDVNNFVYFTYLRQ